MPSLRDRSWKINEAASALAKIIVIGAKAQTILQYLSPDINVRAMKTSILRNMSDKKKGTDMRNYPVHLPFFPSLVRRGYGEVVFFKE
jgi:hypothetical protein